jgi:hypothetical protein
LIAHMGINPGGLFVWHGEYRAKNSKVAQGTQEFILVQASRE